MPVKIVKIVARELIWLLVATLTAFALTFFLFTLMQGEPLLCTPIHDELKSENLLKVVLFAICFSGIYLSRITWLAIRTVYGA
jgi:hypothetical protein